MAQLEQGVETIERVRRMTFRQTQVRYPWGCLLEAVETEDGATAWRMTTRGGERLYLTAGMLSAAGAEYFWLQGRTPCHIAPWDPKAEADALAGDLLLEMYHAPLSGPRGVEHSLLTISRLALLTSCRPVVLLGMKRPASWPP